MNRISRHSLSILALALAWSAQVVLADNPSPVQPVILGVPDGCLDSSPKAMNNGADYGTLVIGGASNCNRYDPYLWRNGTWSRVTLPTNQKLNGGWVASVSDDNPFEPTFTLVVIHEGYNSAMVKMQGQPASDLPLLNGMSYAATMVVSSRGDHIVGSNFSNVSASRRAVRWKLAGSAWLPPEDIGPGAAVATTEDGSVVVGNGGGGPWVWTEKTTGGGDLVLLDRNAVANDITHSGSMIVGKRNKPCSTSKCTVYPAPVYWVIEGGQWRMHDLEAIDDVDSEALAVAEVGGIPVIVGSGYTKQDGGILRPVAWIPSETGNYGAPLRLQPLGGALESWAVAKDINRNGLVIGWSDRSITDLTTVGVAWSLFEQPEFAINNGLAGAWFNPDSAGQGQLLDIEPGSRFMFLSWFTYTDAASERPGGQQWFTAQGHYNGSNAVLAVYETLGGRFDNPQPVTTEPVGQATLSFSGCGHGQLSYSIDSWGIQGAFPLERAIPGTENVCQEIAQGSVASLSLNEGWDGAWYDEDTPGQGFLVDAHPNPDDEDFIFLAWFTYGDETGSGQRWLTAQGSLEGSSASLTVYESSGGNFDDPALVETKAIGSMSIEFIDCKNAILTYSLTGEGTDGEIEIQRAIPGTEKFCEELAK